jgi:Flp pilus assembly protein TadG
MVTHSVRTRRREDGQVLAIFVLALVAIIGGVGLVLDGGSAFSQRRDEQTAADLAALAGANDYLVNASVTSAQARAQAFAAANGYANGTDGVAVTVTVSTGLATSVKVDVTKPHPNTFSSILGMPTWDVSATATALTGVPNTATGAAPFTFNREVYNTDGSLKYTDERGWGETNGDVPTSVDDMAWTDFRTGSNPDNVNTSEVRGIIDGSNVIVKTIAFGTYIGQHNNGNHTALYSDVNQHLSGKDVPVPIVDDAGGFMGWGMFHVVSAAGGSTKQIRGYFISAFQRAELNVGADCNHNNYDDNGDGIVDNGENCSAIPGGTGAYVLKLVE